VVACERHLALAREVAARSMVLLRNQPVGGRPVLPLPREGMARLAVVGRLGDLPNLGDHGSSDVRAPWVVTPLAGLRDALPATQVTHSDGSDQATAVEHAGAADAAVVVVGYTAEDEGEYVGPFDPGLATLYPPSEDPRALDELAAAWEAGPQLVGGDRDSLRLTAADEALIRAVAAANPRTIVVVMAGAAVVMERWRHDVPAILMAWYPGMEGGSALADVLLGTSEPGGRLPFVVPRDEADLPPFDKHATTVTYDRWYGQRLLDRDGRAAAYPLGFGLSYTSFTVDEVEVVLDREAATLDVRATVANTGSRPGSHVVQVYACQAPPERAGTERSLVGFARADCAPGRRVPVRLHVPLQRLSTRLAPGRWVVPPGSYRIDVGASAADPGAVSVTVELPEGGVR
jgi:beta-glucosidase